MSMLITKEQVVAAMSLDVKGVSAALVNGGYNDTSELLDVDYLGMNLSGMFAYKIIYDDGDDEPATGAVYVSYKREPLSNRLYLSAEY